MRHPARRSERLASARGAATRGPALARRRPGLDERRQGQREAHRGAGARGRRRDHARAREAHVRAGVTMNDPVAVALKFGFLAVLYLFLLWVARSSLRDLTGRRAAAATDEGQA